MIKNSILLFISLCSMVSSAQPVINDTIKIGNYLVVLRAPRPHAVRSQHFECSHFINISCPNDMTVISVFWGVNTMRNFIKGKEISKISKRNANGSRFTRRITSTNISGKLLFEVEDDYEDSNISVMCYRVPSEKLNDYENMLDNVRIVNLSPGDATQPYKYTGKELDRQNGADTYDYHARTQLSCLGQFLQMDPKCEGTPWLSPYTFCSGNPVNRIDIDGMDDYIVNRNGQISIERLTNDRTDRLYSYNKELYIDVSKDFMSSKRTDDVISSSVSYGLENVKVTTYSSNDAYAVYQFMKHNTDVEWSYVKFENGTKFLGSTNIDGIDVSQDYIFCKHSHIDKISEVRHIHPNGSLYVSEADVTEASKIQNHSLHAKFFIDIAHDDESIQYDSNSEINLLQEIFVTPRK